MREEVKALEYHAYLCTYFVYIGARIGKLDRVDEDLTSVHRLKVVQTPEQSAFSSLCPSR